MHSMHSSSYKASTERILRVRHQKPKSSSGAETISAFARRAWYKAWSQYQHATVLLTKLLCVLFRAAPAARSLLLGQLPSDCLHAIVVVHLLQDFPVVVAGNVQLLSEVRQQPLLILRGNNSSQAL